MLLGYTPSEPVIRFSAFILIFAVMAIFEIVAPRILRPEMQGTAKAKRWFTNISMVILSSVVLRIAFPAAAVGTALWAQENGWGILRFAGLPSVFSGILAFIALDFAVWLEHVASHKIPLLWRIHRMHHADTGFDVTTALRFHPLEIVLSMVWKALIIIVLGPPAEAVLMFEIVLNGTAMFNHSNAKLPLAFDRVLRLVLVTPDMHRVHHSTVKRETDSNYGFNFPYWDRLFGTYRNQPSKGHDGMDIGLEEFRGDKPARLGWALLLPFLAVNARTGYPQAENGSDAAQRKPAGK